MNFDVTVTDDNGGECVQAASLLVAAAPECVDWPSMAWGVPTLNTVGNPLDMVRTFTPTSGTGNVAVAYAENLNNTADGSITNTFQIQCTKTPCWLKLSILFEHFASGGTGLDSITVVVNHGVFGPTTFSYISSMDPDGLRVFNLNVLEASVPFLVTGSVSAQALGLGGPPGFNTWAKATVIYEVL